MPAKLEIEIIDRSTGPVQQPGAPGAPATGVPPPVLPGQSGPGTGPAGAPPGQSLYPPGSVGDVAQRWQQTGAMNTVSGNVPGTSAPVVAQVGPAPQQNTVAPQAGTSPQSQPTAPVVSQVAQPAPATPVVSQVAQPAGGGAGGQPPTPPVTEVFPEDEPFGVTGRAAKVGWKQASQESETDQAARRSMTDYNLSEKEIAARDSQEKGGGGGEGPGLDRLLWQAGLGKLGNLAAMTDKMASMPADASAFQKGMGAVGVAQAASGVAGGVADTFSGAMRGAGSFAAGIAGNDTGTISKVVDGMEGLARKIPVVGEAIGGVLGAIAAPGRALQEVFGALVNRGKEIGQYSGAISQAQAMQEVANTLADIRESQDNGEGYAALINAQTEFNMAWREAFEPVRKVLVEELTSFMEDNKGYLKAALQIIANDVAIVARAVTGMIRIMATMGQQLGGVMTAGLTDQFLGLFNNVAEMNERQKKKDPQGTLDDLFTVLEGRRQQGPGGNP